MKMERIDIQDYSLFPADAVEALNHFLLQKKYSRAVLVCDENTMRSCLPEIRLDIPYITTMIPAGEQHKNILTCEKIWVHWLEHGLDRKTIVVLLGGGVTGDMGGFAAATFKRGIDFVHMPTSLMAMTDSCIGGKLGIDLEYVKNAVGLFKNPKAIFVNLDFLNTLPTLDMKNGLVEITKHALIAGKNLFLNLNDNYSGGRPVISPELLKQSILIKKSFVERDPFESNVRKALNFGHTIGHAIESFFLKQNAPISHGEAVCLGMIAECKLSHQLDLIDLSELDMILAFLQKIYPENNYQFTFENIESFLINDKKNEGGNILFSLLKGLGGYSINKIVPMEMVREIFV